MVKIIFGTLPKTIKREDFFFSLLLFLNLMLEISQKMLYNYLIRMFRIRKYCEVLYA